MSVAGIVLSRSEGIDTRRFAPIARIEPCETSAAGACATEAELDEVVVVLAEESRADEFPGSVTLLLDADGLGGARALRSAIDWCQREGHDAAVVALDLAGDAFEPARWTTLARTPKGPIAILGGAEVPTALARLAAESWPTVPLDGSLTQVTTVRPELVVEVEVAP